MELGHSQCLTTGSHPRCTDTGLARCWLCNPVRSSKQSLSWDAGTSLCIPACTHLWGHWCHQSEPTTAHSPCHHLQNINIMDLHLVWNTWQKYWQVHFCIKRIIMSLTVSGKKIPEVNGDGDPVLAEEVVSVAPDTDIHGAGSWLWCQTSKIDGLFGKGVHTPALSFISRKSVRTSKNAQTLPNL